MGEDTAIRKALSMSIDSSVQRKRNLLIFRTLGISALLIFGVESLLMLTLEFYFALPHLTILLMDGLVLALVLFPINYFLILKPMFRQLDEHHRINQELLKSYEMLERFFSINDVMIALLDANFNFIRVNQSYANADERTPDYYVGKNHFDLFPHEENQRIFTEVIRSGKPYRVAEKPFEYADNPERGVTYWDWDLLPIKDPQGHVDGLLLALTNVTDRKLAEQALAKSERRFRAIFDQSFQHMALLQPDGRILLANQTALTADGLSESQIQGKLLWEVPVWDMNHESPCFLEDAVALARSGQVARCEAKIHTLNGEEAFIDITIKPMLDEDGKTDLLIYESRDITQRIRDAKALKHSEEEIQRLYLAEKQARQFAETLRDAGQALSGSLNTQTVLETLLRYLFQLVPYDSAHIYLFEDENHLVVRLAQGEEGWNEAVRLLGRQFEISEMQILRPVLAERKTVSIPDTSIFEGTPCLFTGRPIGSWLGMPLLAGDQVIGVCALEHDTPCFFTQDFIHWASTMTSQAAVAIQNAWLFEQVRDGRERLQQLSHRLVEVQENERHYIAQELHDDAGSALASLMVGLKLLERDSDYNPAVLERSQELKQVAEGVLENLRRLAKDLRPASLDHLGLVAALRQHVEVVSDQHGLPIRFEVIGKIDRLPGEMETAVYRIVQEALTNVVRHSQATRVDILLEKRGNRLFVIVEDNGIGFDPLIPKVGQLGMLGMRERADMLSGSLKVESTPGNGATILLEVPCPSES